MEALALGADVIASNVTALPEILGNSAHYIDPNEAKVDLNCILVKQTDIPEQYLNKYSFINSARSLLEVIGVK